ncbi:hypothetical protein [Streptomyces sp. NRRL F-2799]|uniref:hypothetical protein n=1 Tax=Streptomyces sp. NRRL F-2799 TaxID=1463844 RepID=UPI00131A5D42|nr:hypothetical protein [Streptomyces sp. NRRL F-2799]
MTDNQAPSEDGKPTSVFQKSKNWVKKNKDQIIFVVVLAGGVALQFARDYYAEEDLEAGESPIHIPPVSDPTPEAKPEAQSETQRRPSPEKHQVKGALVDIGDRRASEEAKEKYRQATGGDELPDGKTYRPPHERGSGEAA